MTTKRRIQNSLITALVGITLCAISACGANTDMQHSDAGSSSSSKDSGEGNVGEDNAPTFPSAGSNAKMASSIPSFIDQMLNEAQMSDYQREVLVQAKDAGKVSVSQYEQAWSSYKQCMADKGYRSIKLKKFPNGLYMEAMYKQPSSKQKEHDFLDTQQECRESRMDVIDTIYRMQVGNPNLYQDPATGIVDCFHRENLVPQSYSASDFSKEQNKSEKSFNERDPKIRECMLANNSVIGFADEGGFTIE